MIQGNLKTLKIHRGGWVSALFSEVRTGEKPDKRDLWLKEQGLLNSLLLAFDSTFFHLNMIVRSGGEIICKHLSTLLKAGSAVGRVPTAGLGWQVPGTTPYPEF
jgi:hypothetical protein